MPSLPSTLLSLTLTLLTLSSSATAKTKISLQWAICDDSHEAVLEKLGYADKEPYKANPIVYYDTWPAQYTNSGIAMRTKVKKHDPGWPISMIKARFGEFNEDVPSAADCVWNRYGNDTSYTCGLSSLLSEVGGADGEDLWSAEQRDFAGRYEDVDWSSLVPFGPYINPKWKVHLLGRKAVFDDVLAAGLHIMEIEIVVKMKHGKKIYDEFDAYLRERGVVLCEKQLPKTLRLLEYLEEQEGKEEIIRGGEQVVLRQR